MRKIKVCNGSTLLSDKAMELYPFALQFYSDKYKSIIDSTLDKTIIFEWHNESEEEVIRQVTGNSSLCIRFNQNKFKIKPEGFYMQYIIPNVILHIVAVKMDNIVDNYHVLAHELFGHAVCSEKESIIFKNGKMFKRNGITISSLISPDEYNEQASEGMIEYIASQIMHLYNPNFSNKKNVCGYTEALAVATQIFKYVGKEKMLELLVLWNGSIENLFDEDNLNSWSDLALELEKEPGKIDIDDHIDSFIKRHKKNK